MRALLLALRLGNVLLCVAFVVLALILGAVEGLHLVPGVAW